MPVEFSRWWRRRVYFLRRTLLWRGKDRPGRMFRHGRPIDSTVGFRAQDLPAPMQTGGEIEYNSTVEHDPQENNYGHCELRVYKAGRRERNKNKINAEVKKKYRTELAFRTRLIIRPLV